MARLAALSLLRRRGLFPGIVLALLATAAAPAQSYPALHVIALSQRADRASVAPSDTFHVTIHVKIAQRRDRIDELILGSFVNCQIISNETVRTAASDGTDFVERLTLQALTPGEATISPAYIDAFDATLGKPMRFSSNAIRVNVTGSAPLDTGLRSIADIGRRLLLAASIAAGLMAAIFVLGVMFVRGRKRRPATAPNVAIAAEMRAPAPAAAIEPNERLERAAAVFRVARSETALADVRGILFELAGVERGATLVDALRSLGERERPLRSALLAAERATFAPAGERGVAGDEMLDAIAASTGRRPANEDAWTH